MLTKLGGSIQSDGLRVGGWGSTLTVIACKLLRFTIRSMHFLNTQSYQENSFSSEDYFATCVSVFGIPWWDFALIYKHSWKTSSPHFPKMSIQAVSFLQRALTFVPAFCCVHLINLVHGRVKEPENCMNILCLFKPNSEHSKRVHGMKVWMWKT